MGVINLMVLEGGSRSSVDVVGNVVTIIQDFLAADPTAVADLAAFGLFEGTAEEIAAAVAAGLGISPELWTYGCGKFKYFFELTAGVNAGVTADTAIASGSGSALPIEATYDGTITALLSIANATGSALPIEATYDGTITALLSIANATGSALPIEATYSGGAVTANITVANGIGSTLPVNASYSVVANVTVGSGAGSAVPLTATYSDIANVTVANGAGSALPVNASYSSDTTAPVVTFSGGTTAGMTYSTGVFTATDAVGVTGYLITESSTRPTAGAAGWTGIAPTAFTVSSTGVTQLWAWAKDAAGNVGPVTPISVSGLTFFNSNIETFTTSHSAFAGTDSYTGSAGTYAVTVAGIVAFGSPTASVTGGNLVVNFPGGGGWDSEEQYVLLSLTFGAIQATGSMTITGTDSIYAEEGGWAGVSLFVDDVCVADLIPGTPSSYPAGTKFTIRVAAGAYESIDYVSGSISIDSITWSTS